jgi:hypothetical protein
MVIQVSGAVNVANYNKVQQHTSIAVPRVLAWECDSSNNVGSEYIIMEKAPGVQLYKKWGDMDGNSKLALTNHLVKIQSQLASIHFPVSGSLYLRESCLSGHPLPMDIDPSQSYCIGPSADRSWCIESHSGILTPGFNRGPCK